MTDSAVSCSTYDEEQLRIQLQQERFLIKDLEAGIQLERQKSLEWMERHNREKDSRQLLQAEFDELNCRLESMQKRSQRDREEHEQLKSLYESERDQARVLDDALRYKYHV